MLKIFGNERGFSLPGGLLAAAGVGTILAGSFVYSQGLIRVSVNEKHPGGEHFRIAVPGAIVPMAMALVPAREIGKHMPIEARRHLPMIEAALDQLKRLPDCTLVEVDGPDEHVRIRVEGGQMRVDVDDSGDEVHVTLPLGSLRSVMGKLQRAAEYAGEGGQDSDDTDWDFDWDHEGHHEGHHQGGHHHESQEID